MVDTPASVVEKYLQAVQNPDSIIDYDAVNKLEEQAQAETSILKKVELKAKATMLAKADISSLEDEFISNAKAYIKSVELDEDAAITAFSEVGVSSRVLEAAFPPANAKKKKSSNKRVSQEQIKAAIEGTDGQFTIASIAETTGGSVATTTKVVKAMVEDNSITVVDPDDADEAFTPDRGRAPAVYKRS